MYKFIVAGGIVLFCLLSSQAEAGCTEPTAPTGYIFDILPSNDTPAGDSVAMSCDKNAGYDGTAAALECTETFTLDGNSYTWSSFTGCYPAVCPGEQNFKKYLYFILK